MKKLKIGPAKQRDQTNRVHRIFFALPVYCIVQSIDYYYVLALDNRNCNIKPANRDIFKFFPVIESKQLTKYGDCPSYKTLSLSNKTFSLSNRH